MKKGRTPKSAASANAQARKPIGAASAQEKSAAAPKATAKVPSILLEGDAPAQPAMSGPGRRYDLGPSTAVEPGQPSAEAAALPEAYGTKRLLLTARDPHWLYAHWDFTREQQRHYNALARDRHLVLRIYIDAITEPSFSEIHVHPESRNWFVNVGRGNTKFLAVLGYYQRTGRWTPVVQSEQTLTPPDTLSDDTSFYFETLPPDLRMDQIVNLVKSLMKESMPLVDALQQLRAQGHAGLPSRRAISAGQWTQEQEEALGKVLTMDAVRRVWVGSLEITELVRRQLARAISSLGVSSFGVSSLALGASWSGAVGSVTSPFGLGERPKSFWFNVNAELIIYGATEPDAALTIAGRPIRLRPDGTFSFRFALPDGQYALPATAVSADGTDSRTAELTFSRGTVYRGHVETHPQDPGLKPPLAEHLV
jgi:hypothetical protein